MGDRVSVGGGMTQALLASILAALAAGAVFTTALFAISRRSVPWAIRLAPLAPVASVTAGVVTASETMLLDDGQVLVIGLVLLVSTPIAVVFGALVGARVATVQARYAEHERDRAIEDRRSELLAWLGHDLRTPLARMRVLTEALDDGLEPPDYSTRMLREVDALTVIIDDISALSRLQSHATRSSTETVDIADLVSDVVAGNRPLADSLGVSLDAQAGSPILVQGRAGELVRAVNNLVVNALRHTRPEGFVSVQVTEEGRTAQISVRDQCGGIDEAHLARVFDPGWRGTTARTPGDGGAGLGLTIAQRVVQAHSGDVAIRQFDDGCAFVITLPLP
jgi:signal transduction histidine kinase